jgi:predicted acylesterase/phospholipase RssA
MNLSVSETKIISIVEKSIQEKEKPINTYDTLVLSAGSLKGFLQLGALHCYHINNYLDNIKTYIGTSIGAVISLLLIVGYTPVEILANLKLPHAKINLIDINNTLGIYSVEPFMIELERLLKDKTNDYEEEWSIPSMVELYEKFQKEFIIVTFNLTTNETEYKTPFTDPHLSVLDAIRMTVNIPLIFEKFIYNKCLYLDGAIEDTFPIRWADEYRNKRQNTISPNILGINIDSNFNEYVKNLDVESIDIMTYVKILLTISLRKNRNLALNYQSPNVTIINLDGGVFNLLELNISQRKKFLYFSYGFRQVDKILFPNKLYVDIDEDEEKE